MSSGSRSIFENKAHYIGVLLKTVWFKMSKSQLKTQLLWSYLGRAPVVNGQLTSDVEWSLWFSTSFLGPIFENFLLLFCQRVVCFYYLLKYLLIRCPEGQYLQQEKLLIYCMPILRYLRPIIATEMNGYHKDRCNATVSDTVQSGN